MIDRSKRPHVSLLNGKHMKLAEPVVLDNGIRLWTVGNQNYDINRLSVLVDGGSLHEDFNRVMQAYFTAMMIFEGTKNHSQEQIADEIDYLGAYKLTRVYDYHTLLGMVVLNSNLERALRILQECMNEPVFPNEELNRAKDRLAYQLAVQKERVRYLAALEMTRLRMGDNHPDSRIIDATTLYPLKSDDLRKFHRDFYHAANYELILAGHIDDNDINLINSTFGTIPYSKPMSAKPSVSVNPSNKMLSIINKTEAVQSSVLINISTIDRAHPDYIKLRTLVCALGGYFGSRLMQNIREDKGYTYGISAVLVGEQWGSYIQISSECNTSHVWQLIDEVRNEIEILRKEPLDDNELLNVKQYLLGELSKTLDTPLSIADYVSNRITFNIYTEYFNNQVDELLTINSNDLLEVAQKYLLPNEMRIVIAGDKSKL